MKFQKNVNRHKSTTGPQMGGPEMRTWTHGRSRAARQHPSSLVGYTGLRKNLQEIRQAMAGVRKYLQSHAKKVDVFLRVT